MKEWAMFIFIVLGGVWIMAMDTINLKHARQGIQRLVRDMSREYMNDTMEGPRLGKPREWEPRERGERQFMHAATWCFVACAMILYLVLQFGAAR